MNSIDARVMLRDEGQIELPLDNLTQDYTKDIKIISYYILENLEKFDLSNFDIVEYSEDRVLLLSNDKHWLIMIDNIVVINRIMTIEYRTYLMRE